MKTAITRIDAELSTEPNEMDLMNIVDGVVASINTSVLFGISYDFVSAMVTKVAF